MKLGLHIIKNPNETYSFVGNVPAQLAYTTKAGNTVTTSEVESQLMFPESYRTIKSRVFQSVDEAIREATRLGFNVNSVITK